MDDFFADTLAAGMGVMQGKRCGWVVVVKGVGEGAGKEALRGCRAMTQTLCGAADAWGCWDAGCGVWGAGWHVCGTAWPWACMVVWPCITWTC